MNRLFLRAVTLVLVCMESLFLIAQQNAASTALAASGTAPSLVRFAGVLKDANGEPITGITGVTFLLYQDQEGGAPLWLETQNITPDKSGQYTAQLGVPVELFPSGETRWLAVQVAGQAEPARVMLVAVPYARKVKDAEPMRGLPPWSFVLAETESLNPPATTNAPAAGQAQSSSSGILLADGTGQTMQIFSNPSPTGSGAGTVQFVPNTGTLIGIEAYSIGLISGTSGDFYCHHGLVAAGSGICYFADVANNAGHVANSFSQAVQFDSVNSAGTDIFTSIRSNPQNSLEVSSGGAPGTSFGTIRQVPTVFANLPVCSSPVEGTTATVTDSTVNTWGTAITGGGNKHVLAYCDGTEWTVAAK